MEIRNFPAVYSVNFPNAIGPKTATVENNSMNFPAVMPQKYLQPQKTKAVTKLFPSKFPWENYSLKDMSLETKITLGTIAAAVVGLVIFIKTGRRPDPYSRMLESPEAMLNRKKQRFERIRIDRTKVHNQKNSEICHNIKPYETRLPAHIDAEV